MSAVPPQDATKPSEVYVDEREPAGPSLAMGIIYILVISGAWMGLLVGLHYLTNYVLGRSLS